MELIDWIVLFGTLLFIVGYGSWMTRKNRSIEGFLKGDNQMKWYTIGLSIMATQASAITFLSTPGQAYEEGMGFIQFYFGLPLAMIIVSAVFIPIYYRLKVFTAYEYLEQRFDLRVRLVTALLFLVSRGLAAGITIYAPAIILSTLLGWNLNYTNLLVGSLVIIYTVSGGTKAVSLTQKWQMGIIMLGLVVAFYLILDGLPEQLSFADGVSVAGVMGKMNIIDASFDVETRYTVWAGLTGGLFLSLSYFGTDQSQVQRYLGGKSMKESRLGLMFNGLLKIPLQFFILFVGVMVFVFYQFERPPAFFNGPGLESAYETEYAGELRQLESQFQLNHEAKKEKLETFLAEKDASMKHILANEAQELQAEQKAIRGQIKEVVAKANPMAETKDSDYIFLTFVLTYLPHGVIGLLLAVIFSAAMSSTAGELNALASTTMVDYVRRLRKSDWTDEQEVKWSRWLTVIWGLLAIGVAFSARLFDNLIQLVNILGSLFYGTILGIFLVAFALKKVGAKAVFLAAILGESIVLLMHFGNTAGWFDVGYLWYNVIGCVVVFFASLIFEASLNDKNEQDV